MTTIAQQIANQLDNDGSKFRDAAGRTLDEISADLGAAEDWRDGYRTGDVYRYTYRDGSVIVVLGEGWELGLADCFCGESNHGAECAEELQRREEHQGANSTLRAYYDALVAEYEAERLNNE